MLVEKRLGPATVHPRLACLTTSAKAERPEVPVSEPVGQVAHVSLRHRDMRGHKWWEHQPGNHQQALRRINQNQARVESALAWGARSHGSDAVDRGM